MYKFKEPNEAYEETRRFLKESEPGDALAWPPYITFELANICNFRCIMCPGSYMKRQKKETDWQLFKKVIDEISRYGSLVRFIGYEEPLLYSRIKEAIAYVKKKGLLLHITTNGSLLGKEMIKVFIDNKVDSVIFSFQGLSKKEYCFMRNVSPKIYDKVIANIKALHRARKGEKPYIKITTTITGRDETADKDKFKKEHLKYTDEVQITGFTHFIHIAKLFGQEKMWRRLGIVKPQKIARAKCQTPNFELMIKSDGNVYGCCGDYLGSLFMGNIAKNSLLEIWQSKQARAIRKDLNSGQLDKYKVCAVCPIRYKYDNMASTATNTRTKEGQVEQFQND